MWQIIVLQIFAVILAGICLFMSLVNLSSYYGIGRIKKRKNFASKAGEDRKTVISLIYLIILTLVCALFFIINHRWIRGVR